MPSTTPREVAALLGLQATRVEAIRPADADSLGNGNWHIWTTDGERYVLRRYHVLRTVEDLAYESHVLRHLTERGWSVPTPVTGPLECDGRLWAITRYVAGGPYESETSAQRAERGSILARLHGDLRELEPGQRPEFFQWCDLEAMGAFQDWDLGLAGLREVRPDLADWASAAMADAKQVVADHNLLELPQVVVHGDFATWNLHFDSSGFVGVIDFDLTHRDSRTWEFVIARVYRAPELIEGYQRTATGLGFPLTEAELAAIRPLEGVFRVNMVMAELWAGPRTGQFDVEMIERQLKRTRTARV